MVGIMNISNQDLPSQPSQSDDAMGEESLQDSFEQPTTIDLLRHGKPEGGEIFRGSIDVALSALGFLQMTDAVAKLQTPDVIVSSPLMRCHDFAVLHGKKGQRPVSCIENLREISFGDWDGQSFSDVRVQYFERFQHYWQDPVNNTPPNGEPVADFKQRIQHAFWEMVEQYKGQHVLCVSHGGVIRAILSGVLASDDVALMRYEVPYASISQIKIYHNQSIGYPQLVFHNR